MKILHTSDWHIDGGTKHGHIDPTTGLNTRVLDKLRVIDDMIDYSIENGVKVFIHAGDITNNTTPSPTTIKLLSERVKRIVDAGMHFIEVDGNHTMPKNPSKKSVGEILSYISPKVHVSFRPELIDIDGVQIATLPWIHQSRIESLPEFSGMSKEEVKERAESLAFEMFQTLIATADASKPLITVAHATVSGSTFGAERVVMMGHDIVIPHTLFCDSKVCYAALGHIHKHQYVGENHIVYSGTPERVDFGEKDEPKGFVVFEAVVGERAKWEFVETEAREFIEVELSGNSSLELLDRFSIPDSVLKIKVRGTKKELTTFDFQTIQKNIEERNPHSYEIIKITEKTDRETSVSQESNLEEMSPIQILELWSDKKKLKKKEKDLLLSEAKNILETVKEERSESGNGGFLPLELHLKNFCSHTDTCLNFEQISQAVLSGENGAGKSSLIDALFWCVWGVSRGASDDELVRNGFGEMSVSFRFLLGSDEWRIERTRTVKTRGKGTLDLFARDGEQWSVMTGNSIKETQERIVSLIGMSSDIFSASAYLRQGESDMFTSSSPSERKEILAELLLLSVWGEIEGKAKEKRRENAGKTDRFLAKKEVILDEISKEKEVKNQSETFLKDIVSLKKELSEIDESIKNLEASMSDYTNIQTKKEVYEGVVSRAKATIEKLYSEKNQLLENKILQENIKKGGAKIKKACDDLILLEDKKKRLEESRAKMLEKKSEAEKKKAEKSILEHQLSAILDQDFEDEKVKKMEEVEQRIAQDKERNISRGKSLSEKIKSAGTDCPACGAGKDHQHRNPRQEMEDELNALREEYKKIVAEGDSLREKTEEEFAQKTAEQSEKIKELEHKIASIIIPEVPTVEVSEIEEISAKIAETKKVAGYKPQLDMADERIADIDRRLTAIDREVMQSENEIVENKQKIADLPEIDSSTMALLSEKREERKPIVSRIQHAEGRIAVAENELKRISERKEELKKEEAENKAVIELVSALDLLIEGSSKKGAVAMVIDSAIPEIEKDSNGLLEKISGGKMTVRFSTTKEKKSASKKEKETSGAMIETLDIWVEIDGEEKSHAMLSGGEKFRVDFAIRIALSKILARRAGTQIRFLMIDEAGTALDEEGKTAFVQSLMQVSDEFEKILFITHLEDLKDVFEIKIFVEKGAEGSFITVF